MSNTLGNLATVGYNLTGSGAYTSITPLKSINTQKPKVTVVDVSSLTDTTNIKLPGFLDNGEFSFTMHQSTTNQALFGTLGGVVAYYTITLADTHSYVFQGIMSDWQAKIERNQLVAWDVTVSITGAVTYS